MTWKIKFSTFADKQFSKLNKHIRKSIVDYLHNKLNKTNNPKAFGKPLSHNHAGLWRYRVQDYRIICQIHDEELIVLVVKLGHRKDIYDE